MGRLHPPNQPLWYSIIIGIVSIIALTISGIVYTGNAIENNNHKFCGVIAASLGVEEDKADPPPPITSRGLRVAGKLVDLYNEYGCPQAGFPQLSPPTPTLPTPTVVPTS